MNKEKPSDSFLIHDFPTVTSESITGIPLDQAPGAASQYNLEDSRFVTIADFATAERPDRTVYHTIARRESITFLLVYRPSHTRGKKRWEIPPLTFCQDFINNLLSNMYAEDLPGAQAYARTGKWGRVQTIILQSIDMEAVADFRRQLVLWQYKDYAFDTFPRDAAIAKADVSILLRASMKTFETEIIPKVLFNRNKEVIAGSLRVLSTRFFTAQDISHKGESKEYWRSIELKGNDQFMRCLRFVPESRPFLLGYDAVQIRGGLRPQDPHVQAGNKRPWSDFTPTDGPPLLVDPRNGPPQHNQQQSGPFPQSSTFPAQERGAKRGRGSRGGRRGRGRFPRGPRT